MKFLLQPGSAGCIFVTALISWLRRAFILARVPLTRWLVSAMMKSLPAGRKEEVWLSGIKVAFKEVRFILCKYVRKRSKHHRHAVVYQRCTMASFSAGSAWPLTSPNLKEKATLQLPAVICWLQGVTEKSGDLRFTQFYPPLFTLPGQLRIAATSIREKF